MSRSSRSSCRFIEIASSGFAAPGATALLAEGSVAMTVASGTRKTRVVPFKVKAGLGL